MLGWNPDDSGTSGVQIEMIKERERGKRPSELTDMQVLKEVTEKVQRAADSGATDLLLFSLDAANRSPIACLIMPITCVASCFADCLKALDARGVDIFLEIGPKPILTPAGRQTLPDRGQLWLASLRPGKDDWTQLLECVAELYIKGAPLDWTGFYKDQPRRRAGD